MRRVKRVASAEQKSCAMTGSQENRGKADNIPLPFLPAEEYWGIKLGRLDPDS